MSSSGNFDPWVDHFPNDYLPTMFQVIIREWNHFRRPARPLENAITHNFVGHLQRSTRKTVPFAFHYRSKVTSTTEDSEKGEIDFEVRTGIDALIFFAVECKRLNVTDKHGKLRSEADKYVGRGGMGCFVSLQYDGGSNCGAMIGYVMDNNLESARTAINSALLRNSEDLSLQRPKQLHHDAELFAFPKEVYQTVHRVQTDEFLIYHLLLPVSPTLD